MKVDDDVVTYHPELLHQWKRDAERRAKRRQGHPLLSQTTVQQQLETIFSAAPSKFSQAALTNAVTAVGTFLHAMDLQKALVDAPSTTSRGTARCRRDIIWRSVTTRWAKRTVTPTQGSQGTCATSGHGVGHSAHSRHRQFDRLTEDR